MYNIHNMFFILTSFNCIFSQCRLIAFTFPGKWKGRLKLKVKLISKWVTS